MPANPSLPLKIRAAEPSDAGELSALLQAVFTTTYGAIIDDTTLRSYLDSSFSKAALEKEINTSLCFVAESQGAVLAALVLNLNPETARAELAKLYVRDGYSGQGIGSSLLEKALSEAASLRAKTLWLNVWQENTRAIDFYKRHGFNKVGKTNVYVGEVVFDDFVMEKPL